MWTVLLMQCSQRFEVLGRLAELGRGRRACNVTCSRLFWAVRAGRDGIGRSQQNLLPSAGCNDCKYSLVKLLRSVAASVERCPLGVLQKIPLKWLLCAFREINAEGRDSATGTSRFLPRAANRSPAPLLIPELAQGDDRRKAVWAVRLRLHLELVDRHTIQRRYVAAADTVDMSTMPGCPRLLPPVLCNHHRRSRQTFVGNRRRCSIRARLSTYAEAGRL